MSDASRPTGAGEQRWFPPPGRAEMLRGVCTELGFPPRCIFRICRRAGRCVTREVACYQVMRDRVDAMLRKSAEASLLRRHQAGEAMDLSPAVINTLVQNAAHRRHRSEKRRARKARRRAGKGSTA